MDQPPWPDWPRSSNAAIADGLTATDHSDSSSDDSLFAAASSAAPPTDPIFPLSSQTTSSTSNPSPAASATILQPSSSSFLSSSSSSDDEIFRLSTTPLTTTATVKKRPARPRTIHGTRSSFILGGKLGEGAYAVVREGIDEHSLRIVAVKVLDLRRLRKIRGGVQAIEREVAVQKRLKRHRNLIELIDVVRVPSKSRMYIVLEMANGCTVQQLADSAPDHRLPESQVSNFAAQTLKGLQYMHGKGVVHRDIKPSNLMLTAKGDLMISDFGVAEFLSEYNDDDNVTRTSGSPAFQAPEIATGAPGYSGRKVDVWALGVTVYFLLTGKIPFEADNLLVLFDLIGKGEYEEPEWMSESCADCIRAMLTVDWDKRMSVDELLRHPWISRGAVELTAQQREQRGWITVPKMDLGILDIVKNMYKSEDVASSPQATASAPDASAATAAVTADSRQQESTCRVA